MKSGREYRWKKHDSVTISGNRWYRHSQSKGGYPVDFVMEFYYATFPEAVKMLIGEEGEGRQKSCPASSQDFRFRWVGAYEISADELLDGKEGKATETKLERGAKLIKELLADKKEISIRKLDEKAKEQGISGRTMRDVRSRMKNELEYQINEKQENSIRLKE